MYNKQLEGIQFDSEYSELVWKNVLFYLKVWLVDGMAVKPGGK